MSIVLEIWQIFRTRRKAQWGKVKTFCLFTSNTEQNGVRVVQTGPPSLLLEAVNYGPGEVTILALKGRYRDGSVSAISLGTPGLILRQGDRLARTIMPIDQPSGQYDGFYNEDGIELVDIWFEDTFGRKHKLKRVRKYLRAMGELL